MSQSQIYLEGLVKNLAKNQLAIEKARFAWHFPFTKEKMAALKRKFSTKNLRSDMTTKGLATKVKTQLGGGIKHAIQRKGGYALAIARGIQKQKEPSEMVSDVSKTMVIQRRAHEKQVQTKAFTKHKGKR